MDHLTPSTRSRAPGLTVSTGLLSEARARRFMVIIAVTAAIAFVGRAAGWW
jgi:hypothetical protein